MVTLNLFQRLLAITDEIGAIEKTGRNTMQGYAFMEQAQIVAELRPLLAKHGVMIIPEVKSRTVERFEVTRSNGKIGVDNQAKVNMAFTLVNTDEPSDRIVCEWDGGEAIDSSDKATNKAITAGNKYFLIKLFNISDKEDADLESPQLSTVKPANKAVSNPELATAKSDLLKAFWKAKVSNFDEQKTIIESAIGKTTVDTVEDTETVIEYLKTHKEK